jgi:hypothetical protein
MSLLMSFTMAPAKAKKKEIGGLSRETNWHTLPT